MRDPSGAFEDLRSRFGDETVTEQRSADEIPTAWVPPEMVHDMLVSLRGDNGGGYRTLYDLTAIDERNRDPQQRAAAGDFTLVYHLLSYEANADLRLKVPLAGEFPSAATATDIWPT